MNHGLTAPDPSKGYRVRAIELREKAAAETDKAKRAALLNDAELYDRMAAYIEKNQQG